MLVCPAIWEAEVGGLLESRMGRLQCYRELLRNCVRQIERKGVIAKLFLLKQLQKGFLSSRKALSLRARPATSDM